MHQPRYPVYGFTRALLVPKYLDSTLTGPKFPNLEYIPGQSAPGTSSLIQGPYSTCRIDEATYIRILTSYHMITIGELCRT